MSQTLNDNLVPLRCFHCNTAMSRYHDIDPEMKKEKVFEEFKIERYCCKMMLLQYF